MDDLLNEFLTETNESLDVVDVELVRFEKDPTDKAVLDNIFRLVHTVKGTCGFLGLPRLESVAHASENVLGKFRDGELKVSTEAVSIILKSIDAIKNILAELEANECEPEGNDKELIGQLNEIASGKMSPPKPQPKAVTQKPIQADASDSFADGERKIQPVLNRELLPGEVSLEDLEAAFNAAPGPDEGTVSASAGETVAIESDESELDDHSGAQTVAAKPGANARKGPKETSAKNSDTSIANQSVRVTVDLLEDLMTMVSELVLTRNQLMQIVREQEDSKFKVPLQRLNLVTTELQEGVMKTRMQPIGNAWQKLPRIVRDLSHELGKKIELLMIGADTELDRQVLELIKDPLTHMIRNSADHGLEQPKKRLAAGKNELGTIKLNAYHEGGHVIIQISDDGAGLNIERIKQKAVSSGLVTEAELEEMSDLQIGNFIFKAGFSTAEQITSVSGRGVGMDVVRTNIEKIGGTVDVRSTTGQGSVFTVKIPLTLAIVSALIVEANGERFAIPQISVIELVRASDNSGHRIERIKMSPVLRLRDQLLPLVYLGDVLRMKRKAPGVTDGDAQNTDAISSQRAKDDFVVVTQVGGFRFGIVVDRVFDTEEIVVKPVAPILRHITVFSGNTILGDGSVIMILDPNGIANMYGNIKVEQDEAKVEAASIEAKDQKMSLLIFRAGDSTPKAVPLSLVARLEELDCACLERSNGRDVVQYRGQLMPLVRVSDNYPLRTEGRQPMLVFADETRTMGLAVDEIVDIVEDVLNIELATETTGLVGTAVIAGAATEVIDVSHYLVVAFPDWFEESRKTRIKSARRILLIDDSPFFRNMLAPVLGTAGYKVTAVENAEQALALRDQGAIFDAIVSDIEMPGMSGFELASMIKADDRWGGTPIVAISAHGTADDFERGRQVGFSDYVVKMDRGALLRSLTETLSIYGEAV